MAAENTRSTKVMPQGRPWAPGVPGNPGGRLKGMQKSPEGPIDDPNKLGPAIKRAIKHIKETGMPALVDAVTQHRG